MTKTTITKKKSKIEMTPKTKGTKIYIYIYQNASYENASVM